MSGENPIIPILNETRDSTFMQTRQHILRAWNNNVKSSATMTTTPFRIATNSGANVGSPASGNSKYVYDSGTYMNYINQRATIAK